MLTIVSISLATNFAVGAPTALGARPSSVQASHGSPGSRAATAQGTLRTSSYADLNGQAAWRQFSHPGLQPRSVDVRAKAPQQASQLQVAPGYWAALGPQPLDTSKCGGCQSAGVVSGRITSLAVNPNNPQNVWAGAADGGAWLSSDGGADWAPMTDFQATLSVGAIALDAGPNQIAQTIYVGTGEANGTTDEYSGQGLLKSVDGGNSWTLYGSSTFSRSSISRIALDPATTTTLLVASTAGIYRSTDGGATWPTSPVLGAGAGTDVVFDPANANIVFAGVSSEITRDSTGQLTASPVWMSTDGGQTWSPMDVGIPANTALIVGRTGLGVSQDGTHLYAVISSLTGGGATADGDLVNGAVYVDDIMGNTWHTYPVLTAMINDENEHQWGYESAVAVDPTNSAVAYIGGVNLWQTQDGGVHWNDVTDVYGSNLGHVHGDQHAIAYLNNSSSFYLGNDGGVWKVTSSSPFYLQSMTNLNGGGLNITQFYGGSVGKIGPDAALYGGSQDNGEAQYPAGVYPNGATTWTQVVGGDAGLTAVDYTNNAVVYEEGFYGALSKSIDGGQTWTSATNGLSLVGCQTGVSCPQNNNVNAIMPFVMSQRTHTTLFAGTTQVYMSTNSGSSWQAISPSPPQGYFSGTPPLLSAIASAPSSDDYVYAGDNAGDIYTTTGGGQTWTGGLVYDTTTHFSLGTTVTSLAVDPLNPLLVYATFAGFAPAGQHVLKSTNGGTTWTDASMSLPNVPCRSVVVNPSNPQNVFVGCDVGVFSSMDGGTTWSQLGSNLPNAAIDQLFTDHAGTQLFAATHGRGMWTLQLPAEPQVSFGVGGAPTPGNGGVYSLDSLSGVIAWKYPINTNMGSTVSDGSAIYTSSQYSSAVAGALAGVYAFNAATGSLNWRYTYPSSSTFTSGGPTVANGLVYVGGNDGRLYAINAGTGAVAWSACLCSSRGGPYIVGRPMVSGGIVYVTADSTYVYALNAATGATVWSYNARAKTWIGTSSLSLATGGIVISGGMLYLPIGTTMSALNATSGRLVWSYQLATKTSNWYATQAAVANGVVYFGGSDGRLYALNATTGGLVWQAFNASNSIDRNPTVANGLVYYVGSDFNPGEFAAYSASTGAVVWRYTDPAHSHYLDTPVVTNGIVYVGDSSAIVALDATSGALLWNAPGDASCGVNTPLCIGIGTGGSIAVG
jgi:outer membrane protein assembly factor BamB